MKGRDAKRETSKRLRIRLRLANFVVFPLFFWPILATFYQFFGELYFAPNSYWVTWEIVAATSFLCLASFLLSIAFYLILTNFPELKRFRRIKFRNNRQNKFKKRPWLLAVCVFPFLSLIAGSSLSRLVPKILHEYSTSERIVMYVPLRIKSSSSRRGPKQYRVMILGQNNQWAEFRTFEPDRLGTKFPDRYVAKIEGEFSDHGLSIHKITQISD